MRKATAWRRPAANGAGRRTRRRAWPGVCGFRALRTPAEVQDAVLDKTETALRSDLDDDVSLFHQDGVGLERLLAAECVQKLKFPAGSRPFANLPGANVELRAVKGASNPPSIDDLASRQRREHMRAAVLRGVDTVLRDDRRARSCPRP